LLLSTSTKNQPYSNLLYWSIFSFFAFLIIRYQIRLLDYFEWGDESETIVTAKMMAAGHRLYSEVFNMHGPLTFLPGYVLELFGSFGIKAHRVVMIVLQWCGLAAIYFSPLLRSRWIRLIYTVIAASIYLASYSEIFSHTYTYQAIAGLLLAIILSQYVLPSIALRSPISRKWVFVGNTLIACLPFLAITYIPVALCLFMAAFRMKDLKLIALGSGMGLSINFIFLGIAGSFSGYLAIHYYLNLKVVPLFLGGASPLEMLHSAFINAVNGPQALVASGIIVAACVRLMAGSRAVLRTLLLMVGIESLLLRGSGFQGLPYWYAITAIPLIFFKETFAISRKFYPLLVAALIFCVVKLLIILPDDKIRIRSKPVPKFTPFSELVKRYTDKEDRILAYSFQNYQYILADRLPGSANFFYLPWQAKYSESPVLGVTLDACGDIRKNRPKMLLIDKMNVNGEWPWESYAACIQELINQDYLQVRGTHYYIRTDAFPADLQVEKN
jgi:uncharacterized membrane protein (UPF0136 family)